MLLADDIAQRQGTRCIRVVPADAMAATRSRAFPQKLHCPALGSSPTCWILAIGVLAVRPGAASTVCTRRIADVRARPGNQLLDLLLALPAKRAREKVPSSGHPLTVPRQAQRAAASDP